VNCEKYQELISAFIDGELSISEETELKAHIDDCPECRKTLDEIKELRALMEKDRPAVMPADIEKRILLDVQKGKKTRKGLLGFLGGYYRIPRGVAWASLVLLLLLTVNSLVNPFRQQQESIMAGKDMGTEIKVQMIELTEVDVIGVRTISNDNNGT
jgi:anti-sigma factor RsiW